MQSRCMGAISFIMRLWLVLCLVTASLAQQDWWRTAVVYQIYPRSFMDSNNDGVGDLKGITSKVNYLSELGVNAVWLSPIFTSPMADFGYDISNFTNVDPIFGNLDDLQELITQLKAVGIKILLDFVPNHSSNEHIWFQNSVRNVTGYEEFYVWRNAGANNATPNNWQSVFSGSAWEWNSVRQQYYLHQFVIGQPDLNYRNSAVRKAMNDTVQFWLDSGVDGFRVDAVRHLVEDENFADENKINENDSLYYDNLIHDKTANQNLTFEVIAGWSELIKNKNADGKGRLMLLEAYNAIEIMLRYYGGADAPFTMPFNFYLLEAMSESMTAADLQTTINTWLNNLPSYGVANWVVGNHDNFRIGSRVGEELVDGVNMMLTFLPGIAVTYQGEELGMTDTYLTWEETKDPSGLLVGKDNYEAKSRDPERTPMQWDDTLNAGFTNGTPWLPVNPNYWWLNVVAQEAAERSHLKVYKSLMQLRKIVATYGTSVSTIGNNVLLIQRTSSSDKYTLLFNLASSEESVVLTDSQFPTMYVYTSSINSEHNTGDQVTLSAGIQMRPKSAVILQTTPPGTEAAAATFRVASSSLIVAMILSLLLK